MQRWVAGLGLVAAGLLVSGSALAQNGGTPPPHAEPIFGSEKSDSPRMSNDEREARVAAERAVRESREGSPTKRSRAVPATAADLVVGREVRDPNGLVIGTIELVDAGEVQILSGDKRAKIPVNAFGKNRAGLLIGMTKDAFDKAVAASPGGS